MFGHIDPLFLSNDSHLLTPSNGSVIQWTNLQQNFINFSLKISFFNGIFWKFLSKICPICFLHGKFIIFFHFSVVDSHFMVFSLNDLLFWRKKSFKKKTHSFKLLSDHSYLFQIWVPLQELLRLLANGPLQLKSTLSMPKIYHQMWLNCFSAYDLSTLSDVKERHRLFEKSTGILPGTADSMSKYVTASRSRVGKGDGSPISPPLL